MLELSTFLGKASIFLGSAASNASIALALLIIILYKRKAASHFGCSLITVTCIWLGTTSLYYGSLGEAVTQLGIDLSTAESQSAKIAIKYAIAPIALLAVALKINSKVNSRAHRVIIAIFLWLIITLYYGTIVSSTIGTHHGV